MSCVDGISFKFIVEEDIVGYEDEVETRYHGYGIVYDYRSDGELALRYRPAKLKTAQMALKSNDFFLLMPFTAKLTNFQIEWTKRFWGGSYRRLSCRYCGGNAHGEIEVAIHQVIPYRRPPKGAKEMKVISDPFFVFRAKGMSAHCPKCGLEDKE